MKDSDIQPGLYHAINEFYKGLFVTVDELADGREEGYKDVTHENVIISYEANGLGFHRHVGIPAVRNFRQALLHARKYDRDPREGSPGTHVEENGVASNPIELDELYQALEVFCKRLHPNESLPNRDRSGGRYYDEYIHPLYDSIMSAKRRLAVNALEEQNTAVGRCLAHLVGNRLAGTAKGNRLLGKVMTCLAEQEKARHEYMMGVLNEKLDGGQSILDKIRDENDFYRDKHFSDRDIDEWYQQAINRKIHALEKEEPHKTHLAKMRQESTCKWLEGNLKDLKDDMAKHRFNVSRYEDTYSTRYLTVATVSDFIHENKSAYGEAFLTAYNALSPSSNKAVAVATALKEMQITQKEDFINALKGNNALTNALKMRGPGMSLLFGDSKTWKSVQDKVLTELEGNAPGPEDSLDF